MSSVELHSCSGVLFHADREIGSPDTSTPEERAQWVEITHKLESSPLDDSVNKQGEAAFKRLSDVHDVHVLLCPALLTEFNGMKYTYSHAITRQYMLASGAFQIANPDKTADAKATAFAAVESVLKTYQAILQQKPDAKAKPLDDLLKKQNQGKLQDSVQKQCGYTQMRQGLNGVLSDLKAQGFTQARIEAYRVSGAVPGRTMNLTVTLK